MNRLATRRDLYALFLVICVLIGTALYFGLRGKAAVDHNAHKISNNALVTCRLLTSVQIAANRSHYADWVVFKTVLAESQASAAGQHLTPQQQRYEAIFLGKLKAAVAEKSWVPIIDCATQAKSDGAYQPPVAIPFNTKLPPSSAVSGS